MRMNNRVYLNKMKSRIIIASHNQSAFFQVQKYIGNRNKFHNLVDLPITFQRVSVLNMNDLMDHFNFLYLQLFPLKNKVYL